MALRRRLALLVVLALSGLDLWPAGAGAAEDLAASGGLDHLTGSSDELAGWLAVEVGRFVQARETAEKILRQHPESFAAHYLLGVAFHYGEGDLPRSLFHLEAAMRLFEHTWGATPPPDAPWRWHEATLGELSKTLGEMDRPQYELSILDKYDAAYNPKRLAQRVWPLMKLRRYDESRRAAREAVGSGNPQQRMIARSDLCAAECEAGDRRRAWQACTDALSDYRAPGSGGQVEFSNASEAALSMFRYDDCEHYLLEAASRATPDSWTNPYQHLAELYLMEGRLPEAIAAVRGAQELRMRRPAWLEQHGEARLDGTIAELFLLVGVTDRAVSAAARAVARPDRQGVQSGTEAQAAAASAVRLAAALHDSAARDEEAAVTAGWVAGLRLRARAAWLRLSAWQARRRAAVLLSDEDFLVRSLRPYYVGNIDLPFWLIPDAIDTVGAGVARAGLERARRVERFESSGPFFDVLEVEARFQAGECQAAGEQAVQVAGKLPQAESLLRGRLQAIAGECARRRGDLAAATVHFQLALERDPGVLRRLDLALPVRLEDDGSRLARRARTFVGRSPRFDEERDARLAVVLRGGQQPEACLRGARGENFACAHLNLPLDVRDETGARMLVEEFHRAAFAFKADLSQADLTTLDGSPTAARADRQVQSLIDALGGDGDGRERHPAGERR